MLESGFVKTRSVLAAADSPSCLPQQPTFWTAVSLSLMMMMRKRSLLVQAPPSTEMCNRALSVHPSFDAGTKECLCWQCVAVRPMPGHLPRCAEDREIVTGPARRNGEDAAVSTTDATTTTTTTTTVMRRRRRRRAAATLSGAAIQ